MANYYRGGGAAGVSKRSQIGVGNLLVQNYGGAGFDDFGRQRVDTQAGAGAGRDIFPPIERNRSQQSVEAPLSGQQQMPADDSLQILQGRVPARSSQALFEMKL